MLHLKEYAEILFISLLIFRNLIGVFLFLPLFFPQTRTQQQAVKAASPPRWCHCPRSHRVVRPPAPRVPDTLWAPWRSGSRTPSANSAPAPQRRESASCASQRGNLHPFRRTVTARTARTWAAPPGLTILTPSCPSPTANWWDARGPL